MSHATKATSRARQIIFGFFCKTSARRLATYSALFVLAWRLLLEVANQIVSRTTMVIPYWPSYLQWVNAPANAPPLGLGHWTHWDGYHFLGIILRGYHQAGLNGAYSETAFFPAFPALVRVASKLLHADPVQVGLALNVVLAVIIAAALYKLALLMCERYVPGAALRKNRLARLSVLLFFLYPASFFLAAFYADALVVAGATLAIYWALQRRYVLATASAFVVICTKTTGIVLAPALLLILLENERAYSWHALKSWRLWRKAAVLMSGLAAGLGGYMLYLWHAFGDPLLFSHVEKLWGRENSVWFFKRLFINYYAHLLHPAHFGNAYQYIAIIAVMLLPFAATGLALWYGLKYKAYWLPMLTFLAMFIPLLTGVMESLNRYALILSPLAVALATALGYPKLRRGLTVAVALLFGGLLFYFAGGFLIGGYFAG